MKRLIYCIFACLALLSAGCASNANQKIASPLLGLVKNEYYIYNMTVDSQETFDKMTNAVRRMSFASSVTNSRKSADGRTSRVSLGRGNELFAIDNQVLVGHDIGNATSNAVNASASIPLNL